MSQTLYALLALCGAAAASTAQPMFPIGATLAYQVSNGDGIWRNSVTADFGSRVQFRAIVSYTGTEPAVALGRIYYQPIISNVDNTGSTLSRDNLGVWRNLGSSGQANPFLAAGLLSPSEGASAGFLPSFGRVHYAMSTMSTTSSSGASVGHRHTGGSSGAPTGSYIRIAGANATSWYSHTDYTSPLLGMVADNPSPSSTWYRSGIQSITIFRQELLLSSDVPTAERTLTITSEIASLARQWADERHYMTWCRAGESSASASIRVGVNILPATITVRGPAGIVPAPSSAAILSIAAALTCRRRRQVAS